MTVPFSQVTLISAVTSMSIVLGLKLLRELYAMGKTVQNVQGRLCGLSQGGRSTHQSVFAISCGLKWGMVRAAVWAQASMRVFPGWCRRADVLGHAAGQVRQQLQSRSCQEGLAGDIRQLGKSPAVHDTNCNSACQLHSSTLHGAY